MKSEELKNQEYKYGFTTDIENIKAPKGLSEQTIKFISKIKKEPKWMLEWRLKAFNRLKVLKEPNWQKPKYPKIDYQNLYYYSAPKSMADKPKSLDEVDPKLIETYNKLGIPLNESVLNESSSMALSIYSPENLASLLEDKVEQTRDEKIAIAKALMQQEQSVN